MPENSLQIFTDLPPGHYFVAGFPAIVKTPLNVYLHLPAHHSHTADVWWFHHRQPRDKMGTQQNVIICNTLNAIFCSKTLIIKRANSDNLWPNQKEYTGLALKSDSHCCSIFMLWWCPLEYLVSKFYLFFSNMNFLCFKLCIFPFQNSLVNWKMISIPWSYTENGGKIEWEAEITGKNEYIWKIYIWKAFLRPRVNILPVILNDIWHFKTY